MRLSTALDRYYLSIDGVLSPATYTWYEKKLSHLNEYLGGNVDIGEIETHELREWRGELMAKDKRWVDCERSEAEGGLSVYTIRGYVRAVRAFFNFQVF